MNGQNMSTKRTAWVGPLLMAAGAALLTVFFFQPWRTCLEDDSPAGCPGGIEAWGRVMGIALMLTGALVWVLHHARVARARA